MIAVKRLQSLFWVLFVAFGALSAYLVSLKVATERNELMRVRAQIASARADIRYLETEFAARANMRQLEQWASRDFHYSALGADNYLSDERQLAHLDGLQPNGPDYVPQPVLVAMIESGDRAPAADEAAQPVSVAAPAEQPKPITPAIVKAKPEKVEVAPARLAKAEKPARAEAATRKAERKAERLAMLDAQLLDSSTLGELGRRAASEGRRGAR
ncbi:colicin transporter [Sphingobium sp. DEHP117]|uniref:colicin transporter n=1 Tax=Sphingobium sp. DEHP117 TaxID=2993436 RepID=UPI0027D487B1|nr:colicin transporter [Sphingobium sp. DEHP117]MDQ4421333.1 colicin transporter [Sphingobium sp. DEHP117]